MAADTSAGQTTNALTREEIKEAITRVVDNHGRTYSNSFALSVRWEQGITDAAKDTENFQTILSTLDLEQAEVVILGKQDVTPGWTVSDDIRRVFRRAATAAGKSIVLIHYAGHGEIKSGQLFAVQGQSGRGFNFQKIIEYAEAGNVEDFIPDTVQNMTVGDTDIVFILDCCYSHVATRATNPMTRTLEILSASDDSTLKAFAPPRNTLTGKLRDEIARRKRGGHRFVILSEVMADIRAKSPTVKPTHQVKLGVSVSFPFTGVTRINPSTIAPSLRVVFSVHIAENMIQEQLQRFLTWIETLPPAYGIELDALYITNSTLLIFRSAYALFAGLAGYSGVTFISEVRSSNLYHKRHEEDRYEDLSSTLKENIPFSRLPQRYRSQDAHSDGKHRED